MKETFYKVLVELDKRKWFYTTVIYSSKQVTLPSESSAHALPSLLFLCPYLMEVPAFES